MEIESSGWAEYLWCCSGDLSVYKGRKEARLDEIFSLDDRKNERDDRKSKIAAQKRKKKYVL